MRTVAWSPLATVAVFDVAVAFGAPIWNWYFSVADIELQAGAGAIAVATFTGIFAQERRGERASTYDALRDAIAASFVLVYLVIVSWSSFFNWLDTSAANPQGQVNPVLNPLTATFTTNFTALTGVVVAFYFGSKTVEYVTDARRSAQATKQEEERAS